MASSSKKSRVDEELEDQIDYKDISDLELNHERITQIGNAMDALLLNPHCPPAMSVRPLTILNCNAAEGSGVPFSKAYCSVERSNNVFLFGDIFRRGLEMFVDFVSEGKLPTVKIEKYLFCKLLRFIDTDGEKTFNNINKLKETEVTTLLANHLFGKLSMSGDYTIDKNCTRKRNKDICLCGREDCKLTGSFGDTSIGNGEVWHGYLDIIVNEIGVALVEDKPESPGGNSTVEVKLKSTELSENAQIIAETIVFSFLQKKRHPEYDHFLTPCIGVGSSEMVIMFYDSKHDILLESSSIPLMESLDGDVSKFSLQAILVSWLVVNYKHFCNGLTEKMESMVKADFFNQVKRKIDVYKHNLKFRDVGMSTSALKLKPVDVVSRSDFIIDLHVKMVKGLYKKPDK